MRFIEDATSGINVIRGYRAGEIRINEQIIRTGVIVSATELMVAPDLHGPGLPSAAHADTIRALQPEIVLLGTGAEQRFAARTFGAQFTRIGIGFEVMDTAAACRTFNLLAAERRRVVAVLMV